MEAVAREVEAAEAEDAAGLVVADWETEVAAEAAEAVAVAGLEVAAWAAAMAAEGLEEGLVVAVLGSKTASTSAQLRWGCTSQVQALHLS